MCVPKSSPRIISPSREQLKKLQWLSPAEWQILDLFDAKLAKEWEIYVRPHMNGVRPDFVLLHPGVGIAVFKVSEQKNPSQDEILSAQRIAEQWKNDILELYCPRLGASANYGKITPWVAITAGAIFPNAETQELPEYQYPDYRPISFKSDIERIYIAKLFPNHTIPDNYTHFMTPEFAEDLRGWLTFPDFESKLIKPLDYKMLDAKQRELIRRDRTKSGYRRIRGAAGSGKSLVLAIRAAKLAMEGKKVLVATYNITLWHYLRDLIIRAIKTEFENAKQRTAKPLKRVDKIKLMSAKYTLNVGYNPSPYPKGDNYEYEHFNNWGELSLYDPDKNPLGNITFTHFHYWCKLVCCYEANEEKIYSGLFEGLSQKTKAEKDQIFNEKLPTLTLMLKQYLQPNYDAILLDEGQDYLPLWWQALRKDLSSDGEVLFVADRTQNIYDREAWTDEKMEGAGFRGNWNELNISYRMPENLRQLAEIFVKDYVKNPEKILPKAKQGALPVSNSNLRWTQIRNTAQESCLEEIDYLMQQTGEETKLANADIIICVDNIGLGTALRNALRNKGIEVFDTFHDRHDTNDQQRHGESKAKKMAFFIEGKTLSSYQNPADVKQGQAAVKITTIHSFKGYEAPIMLLYLENSAPELFYTAFTRIKERPEGSILSIICADPNFKKFGEQFPKHGGEFFDKTGANDSAIRTVRLHSISPRNKLAERNSELRILDLDDEVPF